LQNRQASNSGEGGEDPKRFQKRNKRDAPHANNCMYVYQHLTSAKEIQIKNGTRRATAREQLPGEKAAIAEVRNSTPYVGLLFTTATSRYLSSKIYRVNFDETPTVKLSWV
jgi:glutamate synthase domain-containing protein 2